MPHTLVLAPGLVIDKVYVGYWFWGRPSVDQLWADLSEFRADQGRLRPHDRAGTGGLGGRAGRGLRLSEDVIPPPADVAWLGEAGPGPRATADVADRGAERLDD